MLAFAAALAASAGPAAPAARAGETWVEFDPAPGRLLQVWKEGQLGEGQDGNHPYARIETDGKGSPTLVATATPYAPPRDARGRFVKALLRVHGAAQLAGLELRLGTGGLARSWFSFALPLYADPEYNLLQDGEWTPITLSFGEARVQGDPDRGRIDTLGLVVRDRGAGPVRIDFGGWALVDEPAEGVATLTFDDGYAAHLTAARLMAARGWRGTAYVIPALLGRPNFLGRAELHALGELGFDVAAHDERPFTEVPPGQLEPALREVQRFLVSEGFAEGAAHLAYPLGKQEPRHVRPVVRALFRTARIAGGGPETIPPGDPHLLRAVNVVDTMRPEEVGAAARRARENKEWLILMFHHLVEKPGQSTDYALADFSKILDELARSGIRVLPISAVWRQFAPPIDAAPAPPPKEPARKPAQ